MATRDNTPPTTEPRPKPEYRWFTTVPQQWLALVVRGQDMYRVIHGVKGWYVDENFEFQPDPLNTHRSVGPVRALLGREFVGIPGIQGLFKYKFAWNKFWRSEEGGEEPVYTIQAHDAEYVFFTPFESQYPLKFTGIEVIASQSGRYSSQQKPGVRDQPDEALIPVNFVITVRTRMLRPVVALMTNIDWFGGVLVPNVQAALKSFVGDRTYDDLIRGSKNQIDNELKIFFMGAPGQRLEECKFRKNILEDAGVEVTDISITDIQPHQEFEKSLLDLAKAQRAAEATIAAAEAEKQSLILKGEGEAAKIRAIAAAEEDRIRKTTLLIAGGPGALAAELERWLRMGQSNLTTYVEGGAHAGVMVSPDKK